MSQLTFQELHNPRQIHAIFHLRKQCYIVPSENQAFQEYPGSIELWEQLEDGRLMRVQRWLKRSVLFYPQEARRP